MNLSQLAIGARATVVDLEGDSSLIQRLLEMGVTDGEVVEVVRLAPLGDPIEIRVRGYHLSLRRAEAAAVLVEPAK